MSTILLPIEETTVICVQYSLTYIPDPFVNPALTVRMLPSLNDYSVRLTGVLIIHFHVLSIGTAKVTGLSYRGTFLGKSGKIQHLFVTQLFEILSLCRHFYCFRNVSVS